MIGGNVCIVQICLQVQKPCILLSEGLVLQEEVVGLGDVLGEAQPAGGEVHHAHCVPCLYLFGTGQVVIGQLLVETKLVCAEVWQG